MCFKLSIQKQSLASLTHAEFIPHGVPMHRNASSQWFIHWLSSTNEKNFSLVWGCRGETPAPM